MKADETKFWSSYSSRTDLKKYGASSLLLFANQLKFAIEDIDTFASNSLTEGSSDKKADLIHIDKELGLVVIAQAYLSENIGNAAAPANKASDLNTAVSWLLNRPYKDLPKALQSHAKEMQELLQTKQLKSLNIWYVHNLPESKNVEEELNNVAHTAKSILDSKYKLKDLEISAIEVGTTRLEEWYKSIVIPILVDDEFELENQRGYNLKEDDWNAFITAVPAEWVFDLFKKYSTKLFSANVRDYLGSRDSDANINYGIKETGENDPQHFWVYNNGITAIVNKFRNCLLDKPFSFFYNSF